MRGCFGTKEFYPNNWICKACESYDECKKVAPKRKPIRANKNNAYSKISEWADKRM